MNQKALHREMQSFFDSLRREAQEPSLRRGTRTARRGGDLPPAMRDIADNGDSILQQAPLPGEPGCTQKGHRAPIRGRTQMPFVGALREAPENARAARTSLCHPERSEGSQTSVMKQSPGLEILPQSADYQDDTWESRAQGRRVRLSGLFVNHIPLAVRGCVISADLRPSACSVKQNSQQPRVLPGAAGCVDL